MENPLYRFNHKVKTSLKKALWPGSTLFEDMGFTYLGPIDGHDLDRLVHVLAWARELQCPVVVHVKTVKGRGYSFAEQNPDKFHGVGPFDPETGLVKKSGETTSLCFGRTLAACAAEDGRVCAITAAMADGTGLSPLPKSSRTGSSMWPSLRGMASPWPRAWPSRGCSRCLPCTPRSSSGATTC